MINEMTNDEIEGLLGLEDIESNLLKTRKNGLKLEYMRKKMKKYPEIIGNVGVKKKKKCI